MRLFVLLLALAAGTKIWFQDSLFRTGAEEAIVAAYRDRAITSCQRLPQRDSRGETLATFTVNWSHTAAVEMSAGNRHLPVHLWQADHPLWNARFRNPHLVLTSADRHSGLRCFYDVVAGQAVLERL